MSTTLDGILVQWGERLFYPSNRRTPPGSSVRGSSSLRQRAQVVRGHIAATVMRRAPQVMVKVTGGGRGMVAIAAHFRYLSKGGRLEFTDDRDTSRQGKDALQDLADQWRFGGERIPEVSHRREAYNIMLSMPHGTDPAMVAVAAREFARQELHNHRYMMVVHTHQANPHVHLSVRAAGKDGNRLNPRKADLHRWREVFAERLRGLGIEAEASSQATRGATRRSLRVWERQPSAAAAPAGGGTNKTGEAMKDTRVSALKAWAHIKQALDQSPEPQDRELAKAVSAYVLQTDFAKTVQQQRAARQQAQVGGQGSLPGRDLQTMKSEPNRGPELKR
jgi:hypothetical protein